MKRTIADSNWPAIVVLVSVLAYTLALTPFGQHMGSAVCKAFASTKPVSSAPARPVVLVATSDPDDVDSVAATVVPRRYHVLSASSPHAAEQMLESNAGRIGLIIVNGKSREGRRLAKLAESLAPDAKVISVPQKHAQTEVVSQIMAVI